MSRSGQAWNTKGVLVLNGVGMKPNRCMWNDHPPRRYKVALPNEWGSATGSSCLLFHSPIAHDEQQEMRGIISCLPGTKLGWNGSQPQHRHHANARSPFVIGRGSATVWILLASRFLQVIAHVTFSQRTGMIKLICTLRMKIGKRCPNRNSI